MWVLAGSGEDGTDERGCSHPQGVRRNDHPRYALTLTSISAVIISGRDQTVLRAADTGFDMREPEPSYARAVDKRPRGRRSRGAHEDQVEHVQEVLSRSSKLRELRDQKARARRDRVAVG